MPEVKRVKIQECNRKLLLGFEPRTSSLPRKRSTAELQQQGLVGHHSNGDLFDVTIGMVTHDPGVSTQGRAGEGNRTLVVCLEGRCSTIELHPRQNTCWE